VRLRHCGYEHVGLLSHDTACGELATQVTATARNTLRNRQDFMALKEDLHPAQPDISRDPRDESVVTLRGRDPGGCAMMLGQCVAVPARSRACWLSMPTLA